MPIRWQELQNQVLQLPIGVSGAFRRNHWRLVQILLTSIQQDTLVSTASTPNLNSFADLDLWTQSLIGVIELDTQEPTDSYIDYLEGKYS